MAISTLKGLYRLIAVFAINRYEPTVEIAAARCPAGIVELIEEGDCINFLPDNPDVHGYFKVQYLVTEMGFRIIRHCTLVMFKTVTNHVFVAVPIVAPDG